MTCFLGLKAVCAMELGEDSFGERLRTSATRQYFARLDNQQRREFAMAMSNGFMANIPELISRSGEDRENWKFATMPDRVVAFKKSQPELSWRDAVGKAFGSDGSSLPRVSERLTGQSFNPRDDETEQGDNARTAIRDGGEQEDGGSRPRGQAPTSSGSRVPTRACGFFTLKLLLCVIVIVNIL